MAADVIVRPIVELDAVTLKANEFPGETIILPVYSWENGPGASSNERKVVPPETDDTEDCAVIALTFVLLKLLFAGVSVEGAVNVPDFTRTALPDSDESSEDPPILPVTRDTYIVFPLPTGLVILKEIVAEVRPSTTKAEFDPFTLYKLPTWLALLSGEEMIPGDWYVFVI